MNKVLRMIILFEIVFSLYGNLLISYLGFSESVYYILDCLFILSFVLTLLNESNNLRKLHVDGPLNIATISFFLFTFITAIAYKVDFLSYILQVRIFFRFYIFIYTVIHNFKTDTFVKVEKILLYSLIPSLILAFLQYFQGLWVDQIGGIFGTRYGYSNTCFFAYLSVCICILFSKVFRKTIKPRIFIFYCIICLLCAMLAEIKFFYFEFILLAFIYFVFSRPSIKKILTLLSCLVVLLIFINFFSVFNNQAGDNFFSVEGIAKYLGQGYGGQTDGITRTNGFSKIYFLFFNNSQYSAFFGTGFGSSNSENIFSNASSIYIQYGRMNYNYFIYSYLFLEIGIFGLIFFILPLIISFYNSTKTKNELNIASKLVIFVSLLTIFYNQCLITDASGTILYTFFAIPFVIRKEKNKNYENTNKFYNTNIQF